MLSINRDISSYADGQHPHVCDSNNHAQQMLPITLTDKSLLDTQRLKGITTNQIAPSMLSGETDSYLQYATKLSTCADKISVSDGKTQATNRCKKRICALCSKINGAKWSKIIEESIHHLDVELTPIPQTKPAELHNQNPSAVLPLATSKMCQGTALKNTGELESAVAIHLTLNAGQTCPIHELKAVIKLLHSRWPRLLKQSSIRDYVKGSLRATEIVISDITEANSSLDYTPRVNPHIHGTIILSIPAGVNTREWLGHVTTKLYYYWVDMMQSGLEKAGIFDRVVTRHAQKIAPLTTNDTLNLQRWMQYSTKGAMTALAEQMGKENEKVFSEQVAQMWLAIESATKGQRLISTSGSLKMAVDEAKDAIKLLSEHSTHEDEPKSITHRWSYTKRKYVPIAEWVEAIDRPDNWLYNLTAHTRNPRLLFKTLGKIEAPPLPEIEAHLNSLNLSHLQKQKVTDLINTLRYGEEIL